MQNEQIDTDIETGHNELFARGARVIVARFVELEGGVMAYVSDCSFEATIVGVQGDYDRYSPYAAVVPNEPLPLGSEYASKVPRIVRLGEEVVDVNGVQYNFATTVSLLLQPSSSK